MLGIRVFMSPKLLHWLQHILSNCCLPSNQELDFSGHFKRQVPSYELCTKDLCSKTETGGSNSGRGLFLIETVLCFFCRFRRPVEYSFLFSKSSSLISRRTEQKSLQRGFLRADIFGPAPCSLQRGPTEARSQSTVNQCAECHNVCGK